MFKITKVEATEKIKKLSCPDCGKKVPGVGILKGSCIEGLTFKCRLCGEIWQVNTK